MVRTDAQKRAEQKYKSKLKQWQVRLKPDEFDLVEKARGTTPRKKWLLEIAEEINNKNN
ncbi:MAG: hypothetical protein RSH79_03100 [Clostridiales bacterium]